MTPFYRCMSCSKVVNVWQVRSGDGCVCGERKCKPTNLTLWEKLVQIVKHPLVWKWPKS